MKSQRKKHHPTTSFSHRRPPKGQFEGKVALITGGSRGQGRSHAIALAREGASVIVNDICKNLPTIKYNLATEDQMAEVLDEIRKMGGKTTGLVANVADADQVKSMVSKAIDEYGRIDILVNNAAVGGVGNISDITEKEWDEIIDVNLKGAFLCSKYIAPHMIRSRYGRIVNISSSGGLVGYYGMTHYCASKHGLIGFTKSLAIELAPYNITVNAVCPGVVNSEMSRAEEKLYPDAISNWGRLGGVVSLFPKLDKLEPKHVTEAVLWLASDQAQYVTGVALPVDAGFTIK